MIVLTLVRRRAPVLVFLVALIQGALAAIGSAPAFGQTPPTSPDSAEPLRIFLDCVNTRCDFDFLRTEIPFVSYVRDRKDADVHVLITSQQTGAGGREVTLKFIGLQRFSGMDDSIKFVTSQTDTEDEQRRALARTLKLGLVRYLAATPLASEIEVTHRPAVARPAAAGAPVDDPWNFWVFRTRMNAHVNGERSDRTSALNLSFAANRTTEAWRINLGVGLNYRQNEFLLSDDSTFTSVFRTVNSSVLVARSLTDHWSVALRGAVTSSTFLNQDRAVRLAPGIEYDIFPYSESTRRKLTFQYTLGTSHFNYDSETIFSKLSDHMVDHVLLVSMDLRQPWGTSDVSVEVAQYLNDPGKHRVAMFGELDVRVFRGLSVSVDGSVSRIRDQIFLRKGDATTEEILVRQRQLATSYRYSLSFGFTYTFGSIYNNIVNPRFTGAPGGFPQFF